MAPDAADQVITVPLAADASKCAATASPTAATATGKQLVVGFGAGGKSVVVREPGATSPVGFHLQITC